MVPSTTFEMTLPIVMSLTFTQIGRCLVHASSRLDVDWRPRGGKLDVIKGYDSTPSRTAAYASEATLYPCSNAMACRVAGHARSDINSIRYPIAEHSICCKQGVTASSVDQDRECIIAMILGVMVIYVTESFQMFTELDVACIT